SIGEPNQKLYPHVIGVFMAGAYMAKYISKEANKIHGNLYGISTELRKVMKPTYQVQKFNTANDAKELLHIAKDTLDNLHLTALTFNSGTTRQIWSNNGAEVLNSINNAILVSKANKHKHKL
ncbi:MAG: hypothetical protein WD512_04200, partial [Candidatus Paceibacterota bacterium]